MANLSSTQGTSESETFTETYTGSLGFSKIVREETGPNPPVGWFTVTAYLSNHANPRITRVTYSDLADARTNARRLCGWNGRS